MAKWIVGIDYQRLIVGAETFQTKSVLGDTTDNSPQHHKFSHVIGGNERKNLQEIKKMIILLSAK